MQQAYRSVALRGWRRAGWIRQMTFLDFQQLSKPMARRSGVWLPADWDRFQGKERKESDALGLASEGGVGL